MRHQQGFTAVEVLVTLIIAFLLVGGAYQAYSVVVKNTAETNDRSVASNLAYNTLRQQTARATETCTTRLVYHSVPSDTMLPSPRSMVTRHSCPYGTSDPITLVSTTLTYGGKEVRHAVMVTK